MSETKKIKSVSFNILNQEEKECLDFALEKGSFSGYVKGLIKEDVRKHKQPLKIVQKNLKGGIKIVVGQ